MSDEHRKNDEKMMAILLEVKAEQSKINTRLDGQDKVLATVVEQNKEMYTVLTTSKTLWDAMKTIGKWVIGMSAFAAASMYLKHLFGELTPSK